jgi:Ice-binding-like/PEP-CTERM motif
MRGKIPFLLAITLLASSLPLAHAQPITLSSAANFAVLAGSTVTNTGPTVIDGGNVGVSPGTAITGFPPGILTPPYTFESGTAAANQAHLDTIAAYNAAVGLSVTQDLTGQDLGGLTLKPGVYFFGSSAQLTGTLTLNNLGNPNAQFVFQIGSTLTSATNSSVVTINGGASLGQSVFWQVGSSATLGAGTAFEGHILAQTSITLTTGATILDGSALAIDGAVTLDSNLITNAISAVPEPGTTALVLVGGAVLGVPTLWKRRRKPSARKALPRQSSVGGG